VVQSDDYDSFDSVILCLFTTYESTGIPTRVPVTPYPENGLYKRSWVMTDKLVTVSRHMLGERIGRLSDEDMFAVSEQLRIILGI